jgi:hypothetical protein
MIKDKYDPNAPETEVDGLIAGKLRLLKASQHFKALTGREHSLLPLPKDFPQQKDSCPDYKSKNIK